MIAVVIDAVMIGVVIDGVVIDCIMIVGVARRYSQDISLPAFLAMLPNLPPTFYWCQDIISLHAFVAMLPNLPPTFYYPIDVESP